MLALIPGVGPIAAVAVIFLATSPPFSSTMITTNPLLATIAIATVF
ncbi:MAG TPA: hypothetical protein VEG44_06620 [Candidatus Acidoferrales bacterium]|nr:hypothetical protein [Candidatus Acidoferrales bacterium]